MIEKLDKEFYKAGEVSKLLRYDIATIYRYLRKNKIKGIKIGKEWRIPSEEIKRLKTE